MALGAAPACGATAARAIADARSPARGVLTHLAPAGEVRGAVAPGSRGLPPVRLARPAERRRRRLAGLRGRGQALGGRRARSAAASPAPGPAPLSGLRGRRSCETLPLFLYYVLQLLSVQVLVHPFIS